MGVGRLGVIVGASTRSLWASSQGGLELLWANRVSLHRCALAL